MGAADEKYPTCPSDIDPGRWIEMCSCARSAARFEFRLVSGVRLSSNSASEKAYVERCGAFKGTADYARARASVFAFDARRHSEEIARRADAVRRAQERDAAQCQRLPTAHPLAWDRPRAQTMLFHRRTQFAVGQGGFHVAALQIHGREDVVRDDVLGDNIADGDFLWVYDCGSEPRLYVDRAIDNLIARRKDRRLDLLFLSHLDRDHMCGVPRLLDTKSGLRVDTIVLPWLDDVERLIAFGRAALSRFGKRIDRFTQDMAVDPVETLHQFGPRQIVFIADDEYGAPTEGSMPVDPPRGPPGKMTWKAVAGVEGRYWRSEQDAVVMQGGAFTVRDAVDTSGWSLIPYVRRADSDCIARFEQFAEVLLDWPVGSFRPRMASASERRLAVTRHRVKLAKAYKYAIGDKNLTSLALWSGPDSIERAGAITIVPELEPAPTAKVAWLGTGDTYLRDGTDIDAFQHHYGDRLGNVSTFVLPHHGSIHNSDPYRLPSDADLWVACAEPIHKDWEHPASELVKAVVDRGKCFWPVKRARATGLDEQILIFWRP